VKLIKLGMDTKQVIAALRRAPGSGLDGSSTYCQGTRCGRDGHRAPYFVMELVKGVSITEFCDKNSLNTRNVWSCCFGVPGGASCHQRASFTGPQASNIMVTMHDDAGAEGH